MKTCNGCKHLSSVWRLGYRYWYAEDKVVKDEMNNKLEEVPTPKWCIRER